MTPNPAPLRLATLFAAVALTVSGCAQVSLVSLETVDGALVGEQFGLEAGGAVEAGYHRLGVVWLEAGGLPRPPTASELTALEEEAGELALVPLEAADLDADRPLADQRVEVVAFLWNNELDGLLAVFDEGRARETEVTPYLVDSVDGTLPAVTPLTPRYQPLTPGFSSLFDEYHSFSGEVLDHARTVDRQTVGIGGMLIGAGIGIIVGAVVVAVADVETAAAIGVSLGAGAGGALLSLPFGYYYDYLFILPGAVLLDGMQGVGFALGDTLHLVGRLVVDGVAYPGLVLADGLQLVGAALWDGLRFVGAGLVDGLSLPFKGLADDWTEVEVTTGSLLIVPDGLRLEVAAALSARARARDDVEAGELRQRARERTLRALGGRLAEQLVIEE